MCYNSSIQVENRSMNTPLSPKTARKTRTKTRKPKFLSLRQEFSPESSESGQMSDVAHHQLTLFPLHPENLFEEKDVHDHVDYFFDQEGGGATSLNGILGGSTSSEDSPSPSLTYACGGQDSDGASSLAQTALRQRERDASEEKWVVYSEVVEKKKSKEEEMSGSVDLCYRTPGLSLKLDYQEILNAWSDKGPLYIEEESPQTVPDQAQDSANVFLDGGCMGGGNVMQQQVWNVPVAEDGSSAIEDGGGEVKMGSQREARVMRYKEKRQSRLFSKRIRYEVRKINAEKRPRMKGRFVKRKTEA